MEAGFGPASIALSGRLQVKSSVDVDGQIDRHGVVGAVSGVGPFAAPSLAAEFAAVLERADARVDGVAIADAEIDAGRHFVVHARTEVPGNAAVFELAR